MFGTIYNSYKNRPAETLGAYIDYKDVIESAFKQPNFKILVEDVHCIQPKLLHTLKIRKVKILT